MKNFFFSLLALIKGIPARFSAWFNSSSGVDMWTEAFNSLDSRTLNINDRLETVEDKMDEHDPVDEDKAGEIAHSVMDDEFNGMLQSYFDHNAFGLCDEYEIDKMIHEAIKEADPAELDREAVKTIVGEVLAEASTQWKSGEPNDRKFEVVFAPQSDVDMERNLFPVDANRVNYDLTNHDMSAKEFKAFMKGVRDTLQLMDAFQNTHSVIR